MKKNLFIPALLAMMMLFIASCKNSVNSTSIKGETVHMDYAELLTLTETDSYTYAVIADPWDSTHVLHRYVLIDKDADLPSDLPEGDIVRIPLQNAVVYTSVHSGLIDQLGSVTSITGVCDSKYIQVPYIQESLASGKIKDLGEGTNPNIEAVIDLQPEAILLSPFQNSGTYGKLGKLGIPIVECADYMETSALGRAEWMKFYGLLFGKKEKADSTFRELETRYNDLKALVKEKVADSSAPTVITDLKFGNTWYVPGGQSTIGRLLADAGADYLFANRPESGSVPLAPEEVFDRAIDAEVWVLKYNQATDKTYSEIAQEYANYTNIKAFKEKNVYGCNTGTTAFYEETPFHPDLLLKDYVKIFHPNVLPDYELRYYKKIQE